MARTSRCFSWSGDGFGPNRSRRHAWVPWDQPWEVRRQPVRTGCVAGFGAEPWCCSGSSPELSLSLEQSQLCISSYWPFSSTHSSRGRGSRGPGSGSDKLPVTVMQSGLRTPAWHSLVSCDPVSPAYTWSGCDAPPFGWTLSIYFWLKPQTKSIQVQTLLHP